MSKKCNVCDCKLGLINTYKAVDGIICINCVCLCPSYKTETIETLKKYWNINNERKRIFQETNKLKNFASEVIYIDNVHSLFAIGNYNIIYSFNEVVDYGYDVIESTVTTKKKGGITRAVIGGAIAGPVGAVVGSSTAKEKSTTNEKSMFYINMKTYSGNKKISISIPPLGIQEFLDKCINEKNNTSSNELYELSKYKELLDKGLITEEEFVLKKKQILNI